MSVSSTTAMSCVRVIVRRELRVRLRSKAFRITTGVFLLFTLAVAILPGLLRGDATRYRVGLVGPASQPLGDRLLAAAGALPPGTTVEVERVDDVAAAERLLRSDDLDAAVVDGAEVVSVKELRGVLGSLLQATHREAALAEALAGAGVGGDDAVRALQPAPLVGRALEPVDERREERLGLAFAGALVLYFQLLSFGMAVATGVIEEKASRVVEILLAKAPAGQLLTGKILGIGAVGFAQMTLYLTVGLTAATAAGTVHLPADVLPVAAGVAGCFVLGYAFYAALYAVAGVLAGRTEDLQVTSSPITIVLIGGFYSALFAREEPGSTFARVVTLLPPTAPMVLPLRLASGTITPGELALSVALLAGATYLLLRLAARIYAGAALHFRGRVGFRQAVRMAGGELPDGSPADDSHP